MKRMKSTRMGFFMFIFLLLCPIVGYGAQRVKGTILDDQKEPIIGANIVVKGSSIGTISDIDGNFELSVNNPDAILNISYIGYITQDIPLKKRTILNVLLQENAQAIDEVVVTGYGGTQLRSKLTNSISQVNTEVLEHGLFSNPAQALSGAVSGVKVMQTSGNPRDVPKIILRGGTNLDGTGSPLIIIDGQVRDDMSHLNMDDIASMDVLKDAGATAIYGARAANGVILITTKKGQKGGAKVTFSAKVGLNYLNSPYKFLNGEEYLHWTRTGIKNSAQVVQLSDGAWRGFANMSALDGAQPYGTGNRYFDDNGAPIDGNKNAMGIWSTMYLDQNNSFLLDQGWKTMIDPITGKEIIYSEMNWDNTLFNQPAVTQDYGLSLSGGNDKGQYYASVGYNHSQGLPVYSYYQKISGVFNGDYQIAKWLKSSTMVNFTYSNWFDAMPLNSTPNYFGREPGMPPTQREYNPAGELLMGKGNGNDYNPHAIVNSFQFNTNNTNLMLGQNFTVDITKGLQLKLNASFMFDEDYSDKFTKDYPSSGGMITTREASNSFYRNISQTYSAVLNYNVDFLKHNHLGIMAGAEYYDKSRYGFSAAGSGAPTDDFQDLYYTSSKENMRNINSEHQSERILSFFGRVNYDYKGKYLLSFTFREDGYSKLLNNRWGFFPGISAGWIISKENFMLPASHVVSFAKLRTSYGVNGNVSGLGPYDLQGIFKPLDNYDGGSSIMISTMPNPGLRWERSNTFEVGLDLSFIENRISTNFTFYNRLTVDKFANIPMPGNSGVTSIKSNQGTIENTGVEMDFKFRIIKTRDFTWDLSANLSYNYNKIVKLPDNGLVRNNQSAYQVYDPNNGELIWVAGYQEGQRPGDLYAYEALGIYRSEEEVMRLAGELVDVSGGTTLYGPNAWSKLTLDQQKKGLPIQAGDVIWKDINGDGKIDKYDQSKVGNGVPLWTGGLNTTFSWRGLSLVARLDYAFGFQQIDNRLKWIMGSIQGTFNNVVQIKDSWTPENTQARYPKYYISDGSGKSNYNRISSMFATDGSYLSFRELTVSYQIPKQLMAKYWLKDVQLSVTGQNLGYITQSVSFSPEQTEATQASGRTVDSGYPLPRSVIFGLKLAF